MKQDQETEIPQDMAKASTAIKKQSSNQDIPQTNQQTRNAMSQNTVQRTVSASTNSNNSTNNTTMPPAKKEFPELLDDWPTPVEMRFVAKSMYRLLKRNCVMAREDKVAIVLWIISSYAIDEFRIFPRLTLISPEKRCGKSTTLEIIESLVKSGIIASNLTTAVLFRALDEHEITLLIDEADTFVKNGDPQLIGILNSGHTKSGARVLRCVGDNFTTKDFNMWRPITLASIGALDTRIMDRSIVINLRRKKDSEKTFDIPIDLKENLNPVRRQIQTWIESNKQPIRLNKSKPPKINNDRAEDNWQPLFRVANLIGGSWPKNCLNAYTALNEESEKEIPTQLLLEIQGIFNASNEIRIRSEKLIKELRNDATKPWADFKGGKPISPNQVANLLKPYGIKPKHLRFSDGIKRGYEKDQFTDAFERYLS